MLAIDIGSTRIKCARQVAGAREPEILRFDGVQWLASHAHVRRSSGTVVFGSTALHLSQSDPAGAIEGDVLAQFAQMGSMRISGRNIDARELLGTLFREVREHAIAAAKDEVAQSISDLVIAVPLGANEAALSAFRAAAAYAGFDASRVVLVSDATAAIRGGLPAEFPAPQRMIVIDCGGRSTRWALVRREQDDYVLDASVRPERLSDAGVCTADLEVLDRLLEADDESEGLSARDQTLALNQIAAAREALGAVECTFAVRLRERAFGLDSTQIRQAVRTCVIEPVLASFERFLNAVRLQPMDPPVIMLSGGGAGAPGLRQALEELNVNVIVSPYADRAVVRGSLRCTAAASPQPLPPATRTATGSNRSRGERMER